MSNKKVWFITGAGRGMGVDFARAALADGHSVLAAGRDTHHVSTALGLSNELLPVKLDVTTRGDAEAAVQAAVDRFGGIDVLVNNAADDAAKRLSVRGPTADAARGRFTPAPPLRPPTCFGPPAHAA